MIGRTVKRTNLRWLRIFAGPVANGVLASTMSTGGGTVAVIPRVISCALKVRMLYTMIGIITIIRNTTIAEAMPKRRKSNSSWTKRTAITLVLKLPPVMT